MKRSLVLSALAIALAAGSLAGGAAVTKALAAAPGSYVAGEALVRFASGASAASIAEAHAAVGAEVVRTFTAVPNLQLVRFDRGLSVSEAVSRYSRRSDVLYAQPNFVYRISDAAKTPNDPLYSQMWSLNNTGQTGGTPDADIDAPEAWNIGTGSKKVVVGVLDTGVDYNHEDLAARTKFNKAECNGKPGKDDDRNGYVDDCHGIDPNNGDTDPMDDNGHGTHTSGTIGAVGNNAKGVTGVNWNVTIIACKTHDSSGNGTAAAVIECLQYMETEKAAGYDVVTTSNSYGGCPEACEYDQAMYDAIKSNMEKGILFAVSAGNSASDNDEIQRYPTGYFLPNVVSTAATDHNDNLAGFSNFGDRTVAVGAPGVSVLSTLPGNSYGRLSGTSMSAPHVAGVIALLKAQDMSRDWRDIRNLLLAGGDKKPALAGKTVTGRRINANGSATCSNQKLFGVLRPLDNQAGKRIPIAAINIDCADPVAGELKVTIKPGNVKITLSDDGTGADLAADDGTFSAEWKPSPCKKGHYTFKFSNGQQVQANLSC